MIYNTTEETENVHIWFRVHEVISTSYRIAFLVKLFCDDHYFQISPGDVTVSICNLQFPVSVIYCDFFCSFFTVSKSYSVF